MAFNPGRNVGRVSIRVVPDTTKFRAELKRDLDRIANTTQVKAKISGANVDRNRVREDMRKQLAGMKGLDFDAKVAVTVDRARLKKAALRKSIQEQFDKFDNIRVNIEAAIGNHEEFQREVKRMTNHASRNKVSIAAAAHTAAASAQMRYVTRPRWIDVFVRINKASLNRALASLAALSGARLAWKWIDDLIQKAGDLDRNLPAILGWTTGLTSLIAAIAGATSGLVGIGQGLISILPAFLVVPGLILNAVGSVTALIVAMRDAGDQLSVLKSDMTDLGDIISDTFWKRARQPIIDLVKGLMPQLRNAFRDLSSGIGDFTAAMSNSLGRELANGRLESIFNGIAEGWRILGTGADGFAGALVSLSNIAATYTPRLAGWFVRQANTFDAWLKAIAEDGRLGAWMEDAIDSMYDVWDATRGIAGVFEGIWKAAEAAGSGGLRGFAQMMLRWEEVTKSEAFQRGATAVFRGSDVAMAAFGRAIRAAGRLVSGLDAQFERFIGSSGLFLGGLVESIADALNSPVVGRGLDRLSAGLLDGLERLRPSLQPIADTFGGFLGLLGDLTKYALPAAAGVLADLMPSVDAVIGAVQDVLPDMTDSVSKISDVLAPALESFISQVAPALGDLLADVASLLADLSPLLSGLLEVTGPVVSQATIAPQRATVDLILGKIDPSEFVRQIREAAKENWALALIVGFSEGVAKMVRSLPTLLSAALAAAPEMLAIAGERIMNGLAIGIGTGFGSVVGFMISLPERIRALAATAISWLVGAGVDMMTGFVMGGAEGGFSLDEFLASLPARVKDALVGAGTWLYDVGRAVIQGFIDGAASLAHLLVETLVTAAMAAVNAARNAMGVPSLAPVPRSPGPGASGAPAVNAPRRLGRESSGAAPRGASAAPSQVNLTVQGGNASAAEIGQVAALAIAKQFGGRGQ